MWSASGPGARANAAMACSISSSVTSSLSRGSMPRFSNGAISELEFFIFAEKTSSFSSEANAPWLEDLLSLSLSQTLRPTFSSSRWKLSFATWFGPPHLWWQITSSLLNSSLWKSCSHEENKKTKLSIESWIDHESKHTDFFLAGQI